MIYSFLIPHSSFLTLSLAPGQFGQPLLQLLDLVLEHFQLLLFRVEAIGTRRAIGYEIALIGGHVDQHLAGGDTDHRRAFGHILGHDRIGADARARGLLAMCADMLGGMEKLLELTVGYLRTRRQFGKPLAEFQVLQHAAVDMYVELETARAMLNYGARMFAAPQCERTRALDAAKFKLNAAAKAIGESAVQLHGGIGMTQESLTGRLFARLSAGRMSFGDSRSCLARLVAAEASVALN